MIVTKRKMMMNLLYKCFEVLQIYSKKQYKDTNMKGIYPKDRRTNKLIKRKEEFQQLDNQLILLRVIKKKRRITAKMILVVNTKVIDYNLYLHQSEVFKKTKNII